MTKENDMQAEKTEITCPLPTVTLEPGREYTSYTSLPSQKGPFRPTWLVLDPNPDLLVLDIKVGKNSQLLSSDPIPASLFAKRQTRLKMDIMSRGMRLEIKVRYTGTSPSTFGGAVIGHQYDQSPNPRLIDPCQRYVLGLGKSLIEPGHEAIIATRTQCPLRPDRLHIPSHILENPDLLVCREAWTQAGEHGYLDEDGTSHDVPSPDNTITIGETDEDNLLVLSPILPLQISSYFKMKVTNVGKDPWHFTAAVLGLPEE